jgi:hypothetical protein
MKMVGTTLWVTVVATCIMTMKMATGQRYTRIGQAADGPDPPEVAMPAYGLPPEEKAFWDAQPKNALPQIDNSADKPPRDGEQILAEEPMGRALSGVHFPSSQPPPPPDAKAGMAQPPDESDHGYGNWNVPPEQHQYP